MKKKKIFIYSIVGGLSLLLIAFLVILFVVIIPDVKEKRELEEMIKEYYDNKLKLYEEENKLYDDYEVDVAFLGDSLTDGYDLERYYPEFLVVNRGIGGETTLGLEKRMKVSAYDLKPKVIVMLIGANNFDTMFDNYERLLQGLEENLPNTKVILLSLTAMGGEHWGKNNQIAAYNNVKIKKYAEKYGLYFVDLFTPLYDESTGEVYEGYTVDGGHFTPLGYEVVTNLVKPVVQQALDDYYRR